MTNTTYDLYIFTDENLLN